MSDDRRLAVLRAIVEDYVATQEPVGSRALVERHHLGVSPATIRNDMAALEEDGYLSAPHTSAGRIPTERGYRLFVDQLSTVKPMSGAERSAIVRFLDGAIDLDDVMTRTVRLLAQLTRQVALVQYPSLSRSSVRHVELVALAPTRILLVVILDTGRVEQRVIETPAALTESDLSALRGAISDRIVSSRLSDISDALVDVVDMFPTVARPTVATIVSTLGETVIERRDERVVVAGAANLAAFSTDFHGSVRPVLEALEEHIVLLQLLGETTEEPTGRRATVRIGHETEVDALASASVVAATYGQGDEPLARLGVLGPTRMDYPVTMSAVVAVARYVGRVLTETRTGPTPRSET